MRVRFSCYLDGQWKYVFRQQRIKNRQCIKLITYASGKSADIVVWIVKRAREEHRSAIEWLNNHIDDNIAFFLLEIKLYQIGHSDIAVKFAVIEKSNDWTKEIKRQTSSSPTSKTDWSIGRRLKNMHMLM